MAWAGKQIARLGALLPALMIAAAGAVAAPIALSVESDGPLPGFRDGDAGPFLAGEMRAAGLSSDWIFTGAAAAQLPDRVEWHLELDPYAGGNVRQFIPLPGVKKLFGNHHLLTAKVELFLDGQYQTLMYGQALVDGGAADPALQDFVHKMTLGLLGQTGAYRAIDLSPPQHP